jgi:hypothetical protein
MNTVKILRGLKIENKRRSGNSYPLFSGIKKKVKVIRTSNKCRIEVCPVVPVSGHADICLSHSLNGDHQTD